jgi:perosamine synthetase
MAPGRAHPTLRWQDVGWPRPEWAGLARDLPHFRFAYSARAALFQLLSAMPRAGRDTLLLPAFHCTTVVEPVLRAGWKVRFYRVRTDLSLDLDHLKQEASGDVAAILVIHFLGFPAPIRDILPLREKLGCYIIEDWAHSFLLGPNPHIPGDQADFALFSFYKHAPIFAGGGLRLNTRTAWSLAPQKSVGWRQMAVIAKRLFEQAVDNSKGGALKSAFQKLEHLRIRNKRQQAIVGTGSSDPAREANYEFSEKLAIAGIPWMCLRILQASNWTSIFKARRENYEFLARNIEDNPSLRRVCPVLPPEACPWAFPVWMPLRSEHDVQLRAQGVPLFTFGETLHHAIDQCSGATRANAESLSRHLLLLSVHQHLELSDMQRTARLLSDFYRGRH